MLYLCMYVYMFLYRYVYIYIYTHVYMHTPEQCRRTLVGLDTNTKLYARVTFRVSSRVKSCLAAQGLHRRPGWCEKMSPGFREFRV